jgi:hypothetical protein
MLLRHFTYISANVNKMTPTDIQADPVISGSDVIDLYLSTFDCMLLDIE